MDTVGHQWDRNSSGLAALRREFDIVVHRSGIKTSPYRGKMDPSSIGIPDTEDKSIRSSEIAVLSELNLGVGACVLHDDASPLGQPRAPASNQGSYFSEREVFVDDGALAPETELDDSEDTEDYNEDDNA